MVELQVGIYFIYIYKYLIWNSFPFMLTGYNFYFCSLALHIGCFSNSEMYYLTIPSAYTFSEYMMNT